MFPKELIPHVSRFYATGSRAIVDPPPMDTDEDWVVLVPTMVDAIEKLEALGFLMEGDPRYGNQEFRSFRKGEINIIATESKPVFHRYVIATNVARLLNLSYKPDRIRLFRTIRDVGRQKNLLTEVEKEASHYYWDRGDGY